MVRSTSEDGYRYMSCGHWVAPAAGSLVHTSLGRLLMEPRKGQPCPGAGSSTPHHWAVAGRAWTLARASGVWYLAQILRRGRQLTDRLQQNPMLPPKPPRRRKKNFHTSVILRPHLPAKASDSRRAPSITEHSVGEASVSPQAGRRERKQSASGFVYRTAARPSPSPESGPSSGHQGFGLSTLNTTENGKIHIQALDVGPTSPGASRSPVISDVEFPSFSSSFSHGTAAVPTFSAFSQTKLSRSCPPPVRVPDSAASSPPK